MSGPHHHVDKDGFPVPPTFEDISPQPSSPEKPRRHVTVVRWLLALAGIGLLVGVFVKNVGKEYVANWYAKCAQQKYISNDLPGAVADLDSALEWMPDHPELLFWRGRYRSEAGDLRGSLQDFNKLLEESSSFANGYAARSTVLQRLERHRDAVDDLTKAISLRPSNDHLLLNNRAYARAIGNLELEEGLADVQRAIDLAGDVPEYLDTRGYLYYLLGRYDEALPDLQQALELKADERRRELSDAKASEFDPRIIEFLKRRFDENEAVMLTHRGMVHEKLGNEEQARLDLARGLELGFDPKNGVY